MHTAVENTSRDSISGSVAPIPGKAGRFYRPELDALRFLAFLMIFVHHMLPHTARSYGHAAAITWKSRLMADFASCLGAGLPLFFALSAYLLTVLLLRERRQTGTVHMQAFYVRRMLRIWPLYFLVIGASWLASRFILHDQRSGMFVAYLLMLGNWTRSLGVTARTPLEIGHLWSISVEEQFYALFPGLVKRFRGPGLLLFAALIALVAVAAMRVLAHAGTPADTVWRNSFVQFLMFAVGVALGVRTDSKGFPKFSNPVRVALLALGLLTFFLSEHVSGAMSLTDTPATFAQLAAWYLPVAAGCAMLLIGTLGYSGKLPSAAVYLGKISYGLYVFHAWGLNGASALLERTGLHRSPALKDALAFGFTIAAAVISYRVLESPFLKLKERFAFVRTRSV